MFARSVSLQLKPNGVGEFSRAIEDEIIPLLRKQQGFQDEITFIASEGPEVTAISLWDNKEHAESYGRQTFQEVLKHISEVLEGAPQVRTYEVSNSTFHKVAARAAN